MNSYERVYSLLLEEALIAEQRRMTVRQKLGVTTALLGGLTAGVANVGDTGVPKAISAPKASVTAPRQQAALPDVPRASKRTQAPDAPTTPRVQNIKDRLKRQKDAGISFDNDPEAVTKSFSSQMPKDYDHRTAEKSPEQKSYEAERRRQANFKANKDSGTKIGVWNDRKAELHLNPTTGNWELGKYLSDKRIYDK